MKAAGHSVIQRVNASTKSKIETLVKRNPHISCRELAEQVGIASLSNIHYHLRRLMKAGRIQWLGKIRTHGPPSTETIEQRWKRGALTMPKLTRTEQNARIEMVARKALSDPHGALSEDASIKVLPNGIKVIERRSTAAKPVAVETKS